MRSLLRSVYSASLALLTDLYELTMAYGYWKQGMLEKEAVFHLFFRKRPFGGGLAVAAGLQEALEFIKGFHYSSEDLAYLEGLKGEGSRPLFEPKFLDYLSAFRFTCDLDAVPEGTTLFPYEPILRVKGPLVQAQLLESPLLNIVNFQTLIASKAARVAWAARPDHVVEFGLRRAQGIDGALSASRAAYIGGCHSTSNTLAGKIYDIPVKGTIAHSWIMSFDEEERAFEAFAEAMPGNCIFLIDTYNTVEGAKKAIQVAEGLKKRGIKLFGLRLDSGDLAELSIEIRRLLDEAGFTEAKIMATNELDEQIISDLKHQGAKVNLWGVGTNLVTSKGQPALDGVYKLSALRDPGGSWQYKIKLSEQLVKVTNPGILQVRRFYNDAGNIADMIYDENAPPKGNPLLVDPLDPMRTMQVPQGCASRELLVPALRGGKCVYPSLKLDQIRDNTAHELSLFPTGMRRFLYPQLYLAGLEGGLYRHKLQLIEKIKGGREW